jgi:serine protease Do
MNRTRFTMPFSTRTSRRLFDVSLLLAIGGLASCTTTDADPTAGKHATEPATSKAARTDVDIQRAVDAVYPALVRIHVVYEEGQGGRMEKNRASGSGAIISEDGYIITNHHVAGRATRIVCRLSNREEVDAVLIGTDPLSDLAILKLDLASRRDPKAKLTVAKFGDSDKLQVGDIVLAMGSPSGLSQSVTKGIVANTAMILPSSSRDFLLDGENVGELVRWIGHDAVIYHGNSGGPLVNLKGEIIGINEVGIATMGGAIPSNLAQAVAREIIASGKVSRSWIGLEVQPLLKQMSNGNGVLVASVLPDSPALGAGVKPGDFITDINGTAVTASRSPEDIPVFNRAILTAPVGSELTLKGMRDGQTRTWKMKTVTREPNEEKEGELTEWGLTVRSFTRMSALEKRRMDKRGVMVDSVRSGGASADAKPALRGDDVILKVNDREIADVAALRQFTKEFTQGLAAPKPVLVTFERDSSELVTVVKVGPEVQSDKPARPDKAWLGIETQVLTSQIAEAVDLEGKKGVRVTRVIPNSPADKGGLKVGDLLLKMDGQVIQASTPSDDELFANLIREYKVGSEIELTGRRGKEDLKLTAKLGAQPKPNSDQAEFKDDQFEFKARDLSFSDRVDDKLEDAVKGVRIVSVQNAGWAALAGLSTGDILLSIGGEATDSIATLKGTLAKLKADKPRRVSLFIKRGIRTQFLELEPKW